MTKEEFVQSKADEFQLGVADLLKGKLSDAVDFGAASVVAVPPDADVQAQIDAAVAKQKADDQAQLDAIGAQLSQASDDLAKALSDDASDKAAIQSAQADVAAKKSLLDQIAAILAPAPVAAPAEEAPAPVAPEVNPGLAATT
jgi:hypothetical protein